MSFIIVSKTNGVRALFTWIPKTGGTALFNALRMHPALEVYNARPGESQHALPPEHHDCDFHFLAVRHPVTWWESCFRFWKAADWKDFERGKWVPGRPLLACKADDFPTFMSNVTRHEPAFCARMYEWYCGPPGNQHSDDLLLRQEHLAAGVAAVGKRLGVTLALLRANVSPGPRVEWPPYLLAEVRRLEGPAIRRFYPEDE